MPKYCVGCQVVKSRSAFFKGKTTCKDCAIEASSNAAMSESVAESMMGSTEGSIAESVVLTDMQELAQMVCRVGAKVDSMSARLDAMHHLVRRLSEKVDAMEATSRNTNEKVDSLATKNKVDAMEEMMHGTKKEVDVLATNVDELGNRLRRGDAVQRIALAQLNL